MGQCRSHTATPLGRRGLTVQNSVCVYINKYKYQYKHICIYICICIYVCEYTCTYLSQTGSNELVRRSYFQTKAPWQVDLLQVVAQRSGPLPPDVLAEAATPAQSESATEPPQALPLNHTPEIQVWDSCIGPIRLPGHARSCAQAANKKS